MKDAKKIARIIRLLDWLNTGIDQWREKYTVRNFFQSYNAKIFLRYLKKIYEDFLRSICSVTHFSWEQKFRREDEQKAYPGRSKKFDQKRQ